MNAVDQFLGHTPAWVFVLFVYLVIRGIKARRPREVSLRNLALLPSIMLVLGLAEIFRRFGINAAVLLAWLLTFSCGALAGWRLLKKLVFQVDRQRGVIYRQPDYSVLPLILATFFAKYALGAASAIYPTLLTNNTFGMAEGGIYGLFAGIFVGKFARYWRRYSHAV
ncbi:DUF6622 family protein [Pantoea sp.]|uniref:DUF6622 family protein n=1 Tax=Pantoea sp. TaxID=69393 RepID=UPI00289B9C36|nr:DUF6622 family protein [Pantoea sp.]